MSCVGVASASGVGATQDLVTRQPEIVTMATSAKKHSLQRNGINSLADNVRRCFKWRNKCVHFWDRTSTQLRPYRGPPSSIHCCLFPLSPHARPTSFLMLLLLQLFLLLFCYCCCCCCCWTTLSFLGPSSSLTDYDTLSLATHSIIPDPVPDIYEI